MILKNRLSILRACCASAFMLLGVALQAQEIEGVFVKVGDNESKFAITDVKEITFSEDLLTLVQTDNSEVTFPGEWALSFGSFETSALQTVSISLPEGPVDIYSIDGKEVQTNASLENLNNLPKGIYVIKCDNRSFKVKL